MKVDLHGHELLDAKDEILLILEECVLNGDFLLELVHGYKQGQVLKNYIRSDRFIREMAREGYILARKQDKNPGVSIFEIK